MNVVTGTLVRYTSASEHYLAPTFGGSFDLGPFPAGTVYTVIAARYMPAPRYHYRRGARMVFLCQAGRSIGWAYADRMTVLL